MTYKKKTAAVLLGLTLGMSGSVFAAPAADGTAAADQDLAARIAAIEAQQQQLTKQLDALKKENAKLKRTSKVAESNKNAIKGLKEVQNRVKFEGFGRVSWDNDNLKGDVDKNDNRRTYLDLKAKFKVNDRWNFNFQSETNQRYAKFLDASGNVKYHTGHDDEDGVIQRIWAEGSIGKVNVDVGRRWRGLGFQNVLFGNESDGLVLDTAIPKTKMTAKAFHLSPTDKGYHFNVTGVGAQGQVGHGLQLQVAVAKLNKSHNDKIGEDVYSPHTTITGNPADYDAYEKVVTYPARDNIIGTYGYMVSAMYNPIKNIFLIGDYARTNGHSYSIEEDGKKFSYDKHDNIALRINYRWSNIDNPGSFQLYGRWYDYAANQQGLVGIMGDKEWGLLQPGSHGWILGFKYVPAKNIEWETCYQYATTHDTRYGKKNDTYHRNFFRTQIDYHF